MQPTALRCWRLVSSLIRGHAATAAPGFAKQTISSDGVTSFSLPACSQRGLLMTVLRESWKEPVERSGCVFAFAQRRDGVTVASQSFSLSLSCYFGDVSSCMWLVKAAHAHLMRWTNSLWTTFFEGDDLAAVFGLTFWWQDLDVHLMYCKSVVVY